MVLDGAAAQAATTKLRVKAKTLRGRFVSPDDDHGPRDGSGRG